MRKVFKYPFPVADLFSLELPKGTQLLHVNTQRSKPYLWALVDPSQELEDRHFRLIGTGYPIYEEELIYVGTFFEESLVFHLFEKPDFATETV